MKKAAIAIVFLHLLVSIFTVFALGYSDKDHGLSLTVPAGYTEITADNVKNNRELLDSLGYSEASFLKYLKKNNVLLFAVDDNNKKQIMLKCWSTEFSEKIGDLADIDESAVREVAAQLITDKKLKYKMVQANSMKLIEIRTASKDSGGDFSSIQYLTIRNGKFYSLIFSFSEKSLSQQSLDSAWNTLGSFKIQDKSQNVSFWDISTILIMILIGALVIAAFAVIVVILYSFVKDVRNKTQKIDDGSDISIKRRKI